MKTLAHILNPVLVDSSSDLYVAQPITFETMRIARDFCAGQVHVEFFSAQYAEDHVVVPDGFQPTLDLERSVLDVGNFQQRRKLPLLADILDRLYEATDAEYLIYTNVDIALMPNFYLAVDQIIDSGYDGFVINRRVISDRYHDTSQIPAMYAEIGEPHRGWDCFVFRRDAYPKYRLGTVCVGAPRVDLALIANVVAFSQRFGVFKDLHLTFHIGSELAWRHRAYSDYAEHNTREVLRLLAELERDVGPFERSSPPGAFLFKRQRLGRLYELWVRYVRLPMGTRRWLERLLGRGFG